MVTWLCLVINNKVRYFHLNRKERRTTPVRVSKSPLVFIAVFLFKPDGIYQGL